jgi:isoaspartyl peptidase/L-asparaginase-like protein (Ntn-hydrolase superfamily)
MMSATKAVMLASERGEVGLAEAMEVLRRGGSAIEAVEAAVRAAEANLDDHYVGVGGIPNLLGEVELDASIMDGRTRAAGAVAGVRGFPHPITIARAVMERLPQHVMLVGAGAERFAEEMGIDRGETLTAEAKELWRAGLQLDGDGLPEGETEGERLYRGAAVEMLAKVSHGDHPWGTVNVMARDLSGDLCVGVSTSGYPWKYPGRAGDSPIIGAGNYCDNQRGAAACTGRGELAIRAACAHTAVFHAGGGGAPEQAALAALAETIALPDRYRSALSVLVMTPDGRHGGASTRDGATYAMIDEEMSEPAILPRVLLDDSERAG